MLTHTCSALGTEWRVTVWDTLTDATFAALMQEVETALRAFDACYSRFIPDSLVSRMCDKIGVFEVPRDMTSMLHYYVMLNAPTRGKITPAIGATLSDLGYDANYSFRERAVVRKAPNVDDTLRILDDTHVELLVPTELDLGAVGKGYAVDLVFKLLTARGLARFLVDGSGDVRYTSTPPHKIVCALEHPVDTSLALGTLSLYEGALCASATNRRTWANGKHHYVDPETGMSTTEIIATWVRAPQAALADILASALFFAPPEALSDFSFEYLIVNKELKRKSSPGFGGELFTAAPSSYTIPN